MNAPHQSESRISESRPLARPRANFFVKTPLTQAAVAPEMAAASPSRQLRVTRPTAKLIDGEKAALPFQRAAVAAEIARVEAAALAAADAAAATASPSTPSPQPTLSVTTCQPSILSTRQPSPTLSNKTQDSDEIPQVIQGKKKRQLVISSEEDEESDNRRDAPKKKKKRTQKKANCKFLIFI